MWLRLLLDVLVLNAAASTLRHQFTSPQVLCVWCATLSSTLSHYPWARLPLLLTLWIATVLLPSLHSASEEKKIKIQFLYHQSCYFCSFHPSIFFPFTTFAFSFLVFNPTTIVPRYESVVSAAKPPGDAAVAAKKQCIKRSRKIRIATIVKNMGGEKRDKNKMLTSPFGSPKQRRTHLAFFFSR